MSRLGNILLGERDVLGDGPPIEALFVQNTNPMVVVPDSGRVHAGFEREDLFVCVHEQFMTETAAMANIVLPATMFLEHTDMYTGGGHSLLMLSKPVIEPYAECRSNHWVLSTLGKLLRGNHRGFNMTEWEIINATLHASGLAGAERFGPATSRSTAPCHSRRRISSTASIPSTTASTSCRTGNGSAGMLAPCCASRITSITSARSTLSIPSDLSQHRRATI